MNANASLTLSGKIRDTESFSSPTGLDTIFHFAFRWIITVFKSLDTRVYDRLPEQFSLSVVVTWKLDVSATVGVPDNMPVRASDIPFGRDPPVIRNWYGFCPPDAMIDWL